MQLRTSEDRNQLRTITVPQPPLHTVDMSSPMEMRAKYKAYQNGNRRLMSVRPSSTPKGTRVPEWGMRVSSATQSPIAGTKPKDLVMPVLRTAGAVKFLFIAMARMVASAVACSARHSSTYVGLPCSACTPLRASLSLLTDRLTFVRL